MYFFSRFFFFFRDESAYAKPFSRFYHASGVPEVSGGNETANDVTEDTGV